MRDYITRKISAAYLTDAAGVPALVDIWDYLGRSLIAAGTQPELNPPTIGVQPSLPSGIIPGDTISVDIGSASGEPAPTAMWDLRRNGASVRSDVSPSMTYVVPLAGGTFTLSVVWTNSVGAAVADDAIATVENNTIWTDATPWADGATWDDTVTWSI